jgi:hypothetical protein
MAKETAIPTPNAVAVGLAVRLTRFLDWFDLHHFAENALMLEFRLLDGGGAGE